MKFGKYLLENQVHEWRTKYVNYKILKKLIKEMERTDHTQWKYLKSHWPAVMQSEEYKQLGTMEAKVLSGDAGVEAKILGAGSQQGDVELDEKDVISEIEDQRAKVFRLVLEAEHKKVEEFFGQQSQYFQNEVLLALKQAKVLTQNLLEGKESRKSANNSKKLRALKRSCKNVRIGLDLLKNYQILNFTAFVKILKKHDKHSRQPLTHVFLPFVDQSTFKTSPLVDILVKKIEDVFVQYFHHGDRKQGMVELRPPTSGVSHVDIFRLGVLVGISLCLGAGIAITYYWTDIAKSRNFMAVFPIFRGLLLACIHLWLWGVVMHVYSKARVNYVFILEIDPRTKLNSVQLLEIVAIFTIGIGALFLFYMLAFTRSDHEVVELTYLHFSVFIFIVLLICIPLRQCFQSTRYYFFSTLLNILMSPFGYVSFKDFFVADQLCSLVRVMLDLTYGLCFYTTGSFITNNPDKCLAFGKRIQWFISILPYHFRLMQCLRRFHDSKKAWPNLANAGKYSAASLVILLNLAMTKYPDVPAWRALWILSAIVGTSYGLFWDLKMDWGLFQSPISKYKGLRKETLLERKWIYYVAALINLGLRLIWFWTLVPGFFGITLANEFLVFWVGLGEILRRAQWNFFRLENEHLNNCENYRVVNVIPLALPETDSKEYDFPDPVKKVKVDDDATPPPLDSPKTPKSILGVGSKGEATADEDSDVD